MKLFIHFNSKKEKICFWLTFGSYSLFILLFYCVHPLSVYLPQKESLYLDSKKVVYAFSPPKKPSELADVFEGKYKYYDEKLHAFYTNIQLTIVFSILGCVLLYRPMDLKIPGFEIFDIPVDVSILIVPAALMYCWLKFGFQLHHLIDTRIALFSLIESQYTLSHFKEIPSLDLNASHAQYLYSLTRANDLRDTGFLDCWFLQFLPDYFTTSKMNTMDRLLPSMTMAAVGGLFGVAHGLCLGLPLKWIFSAHNATRKHFLIAIILLIVNFLLIIGSHLTFYYTGRNYNGLSFWILGVGIISFLFVMSTQFKNRLKSGGHSAKLQKLEGNN